MLKLVMFDWNGTALDDLKLSYGSVQAIFNHYSIPPPSLEVFLRETTANVPEFLRKLGIPEHARNEEMGNIRQEHFRKHWSEASLRDGVKETLELCQTLNLRAAVVSAERQSIIEERCRELNLIPYFTEIRGDAFHKIGAFREILASHGCKPENAIYVDDSRDGIRSARAVGLRTIGFTGGYHPREQILLAEPDFPNSEFPHVDDFGTVAKIIEWCANNRS